MHIEIGLATKFRLKVVLLNMWIKLSQKGYFSIKKYENYHRMLHIQINLHSKFQLQQVFETNLQKKYTSGRNQNKMNITIEFFIFKLV